ncbi:MAG: hypothetical protein K5906_03810 [Bacilli bacterium]|nr:hypothetical protein [Bacilli bacterium]
MSEIKGQLLGIIIVLMVFAAVSGAMVAIFKNFSDGVSNNVVEIISSTSSH